MERETRKTFERAFSFTKGIAEAQRREYLIGCDISSMEHSRKVIELAHTDNVEFDEALKNAGQRKAALSKLLAEDAEYKELGDKISEFKKVQAFLRITIEKMEREVSLMRAYIQASAFENLSFTIGMGSGA